jgi:hypothetical protein
LIADPGFLAGVDAAESVVVLLGDAEPSADQVTPLLDAVRGGARAAVAVRPVVDTVRRVITAGVAADAASLPSAAADHVRTLGVTVDREALVRWDPVLVTTAGVLAADPGVVAGLAAVPPRLPAGTLGVPGQA